MFLSRSHPPLYAWLRSQWGVSESVAEQLRAILISGPLGGLLSWAFLGGSNGEDAQLSLSKKKKEVAVNWDDKET